MISRVEMTPDERLYLSAQGRYPFLTVLQVCGKDGIIFYSLKDTLKGLVDRMKTPYIRM